MRNQQIKKVNRIFFSGQDEEKRKWIEQMAADGWQLISGTSFVYSFQKISSEKELLQPSYRSILGLDLQKSMPIFQESRQDWVARLSERDGEQTIPTLSVIKKQNPSRQTSTPIIRHILLGVLSVFVFVILSFSKIAIISHSQLVSIVKWQILATLLLAGLGIVVGMAIMLKGFLKKLVVECRLKK